MPLTRRHFLSAAALSPLALRATPSPHTFTVGPDHFLLDGKPFQILSGEMHYPRVPQASWRDRMKKARALGLNTISTYVFWNAHEPRPGEFDFSGNLDLRTYIETAQQEGLWVSLRPGPYVCAEWDFGGFPAWLLAQRNIRIRSTDPGFLKAAARFIERVAREVGTLQITHGGPIILCQVENEYGSFGSDHDYMRAIKRIIANAGFDVPLFTADGAAMLEKGALEDTLAVINFGAGDNVAGEFQRLERFRPSGPRMCGEFWDGWFNHWRETRTTVPADRVTSGLEWMASRGISANLYMFHGGTSFGFMAGANTNGNAGHRYQPDISEYDYDALLDEAGRPTPKFYAVRDVLQRHQRAGTELPPLPPAEPAIAIPRFDVTAAVPLSFLLGEPERSAQPKHMEALGQSYGLVLYRTRSAKAGRAMLELPEVRDYALFFAGGERLGVLDRSLGQTKLELVVPSGQPLDILVEAMGRVNFGPKSTDDWKGLTAVLLDGKPLEGWQQYRLPLDNPSGLQFGSEPVYAPAFYRASFDLKDAGYTFFDMRGWGKGYAWVNGHNLGRYWSVGPQRTLFAPAEWLKQGSNEIIVLDLWDGPERSIESHKDPIWDVPGAVESVSKS